MNERVLIAEPDSDLAETYALYFERLGYQVETAVDGVRCLWKLGKTAPGLLVLAEELLWGGADGVLAVMRAHRVLSTVPVVMITSDGSSNTFCGSPVVACLQKPFRLGLLRRYLPPTEQETLGEQTVPAEPEGSPVDQPSFPISGL